MYANWVHFSAVVVSRRFLNTGPEPKSPLIGKVLPNRLHVVLSVCFLYQKTGSLVSKGFWLGSTCYYCRYHSVKLKCIYRLVLFSLERAVEIFDTFGVTMHAGCIYSEILYVCTVSANRIKPSEPNISSHGLYFWNYWRKYQCFHLYSSVLDMKDFC